MPATLAHHARPPTPILGASDSHNNWTTTRGSPQGGSSATLTSRGLGELVHTQNGGGRLFSLDVNGDVHSWGQGEPACVNQQYLDRYVLVDPLRVRWVLVNGGIDGELACGTVLYLLDDPGDWRARKCVDFDIDELAGANVCDVG